MKVALVYDRVNKWGGAERGLLALHELFPEAPLYTSVFNSNTAPWTRVFRQIYSSFLQKVPGAAKRHELFPFLMPIAFETFDFSNYQLVISVTSEAAKGIITCPGTYHLCYLLTPTRYLWSGYDEYFNNSLKRFASRPIVSYLRSWDLMASHRPDKIISISQEVAKRTREYYGIKSDVIYPPVNTDRYSKKITNWRVKSKLEKNGIAWGQYFLVVGRLVSYKKTDLVIEAFNQLKRPLVVIGIGSEQKKLQNKAGKNIYFTGAVTEQDLSFYYQGAKALIFPQSEDFGIVAVEAQAAGKPVIAYRAGGALETVVENKTGIFFDSQTVNSLKGALMSFDPANFKREDCIANAQRFTKEKFLMDFGKLTKDLIAL